MIKNIIFILFITTLMLACSTSFKQEIDTSNYKTITIDQIPENAGLKYSDIFDSIKIVRLETTDESLIGRIDKIIYHGDRIYVMDQVLRKLVLVFNIEGQHLFNIGENGKGPGEYDEPNDMAIDPFSGKIMVWCNNSRKIFSYNFDGTLFEEIKFDHLFTSFSVIAPEKFALYIDRTNYADSKMEIKHHLLIADKSGKILKREFEFGKLTKGGHNFFNNNIGRHNVSPGYSNSIFRISPDSISLKFQIDFGKHTIPKDFFDYPKHIFREKLKHSDYAFLKSFSESENYLVFSFVYHSMIYNGFYFKKTNRMYFANLFLNDFAGLVRGGPIMTGNNDVFVSYFEPYQIESIIDILNNSKNDSSKIKDKLLSIIQNPDPTMSTYKDLIESTTLSISKRQYEIINAISPSDNPVLILHYMGK